MRLRSRRPARTFFAVLTLVACCCCAAALSRGADGMTPSSAPTSAPSTSPSQGVGAPALLSHGAGDIYWLGYVQAGENKGDSEQTRLYVSTPSSDGWQLLPQLATRAISLTDYQQALAVVTQSGDWLLTWRGGSSSGRPLPRGATLAALVGNENSLWAVGLVPGGMDALASATTTKTTAPTTSATAPTTQHAEPSIVAAPTTRPATPVLFSLDRGNWTPRADFPDSMRGVGRGQVDLAVINNEPVVAVPFESREILIARFVAGAGWSDLGRVTPSADTMVFSLLAGVQSQPIVWVAPRAGPGSLYVLRNKEWTGPIPLSLKDGDLATQRTIAVASERLRLAYLRKDRNTDRLFEQKYDLSPDHLGQKVGEASEVQLPAPPPGENVISNWLQVALMAALLLVIGGSFRRRGAMVRALVDPDRPKLALAPFGRRFLAGVIDAAPLLVTLGVIASHFELRDMDALTQKVYESVVGKPWLIAIVAVIAHTAIAELVLGRSVGKLLLGLRVVSLDGARPTPGAILIRNFLRIVDLTMWVTLFMILYSPLRQRVGDVAAGTVVVREGAGEEADQKQNGK